MEESDFETKVEDEATLRSYIRPTRLSQRQLNSHPAFMVDCSFRQQFEALRKDRDREFDHSVGLHCFCGRRDEGWTIGCGGCKGRQHRRCVGLKKEHSDCTGNHACKTCTEAKGMRTTWLVLCSTLNFKE